MTINSVRDDRGEPNPPQPPPFRLDLLNVALATAVVVLVVQAFTLVDLIRQVLLLLVLAILFATAIEPLVARLRRTGVGRGPSVLGIYIAIVGVVIALGFLASQAIAEQVSSLMAALPSLSERLSSLAASLPYGPIRDAAMSAAGGLTPAQLGPLFASTFTVGTLAELVFVTKTVFETVFAVVTVFVMTYFWLAEKRTVRRLVLQAMHKEHRLKALRIWEDVEAKFGAWVHGQMVLMLIIGLAQGVGYAILGLPFALLLGVFAGLAEAIPMVGPYLGAIPALLIALAISPNLALILLAYTVVLHLVESNVLVPRIMEHAVGLTPLTVLLALLVGSALGGLIGALLAIPIAAGIQATIVDLVRKPDTQTAPVGLHQPGGEEKRAF
ncbi:MAG: AI-2E family transporter [Chloroflexota bacterium]